MPIAAAPLVIDLEVTTLHSRSRRLLDPSAVFVLQAVLCTTICPQLLLHNQSVK